ncbi:VOC family protein [Stenotrophomonas acidaminiphila]|uniref:VOC family protein n=1 Tax=Stenotrophomonas acidaminiphila TaxID=128780 RepID=UPI0039BD000D
MTALFDRIDTFILPVDDYQAAVAWYAAKLGLQATYVDAGQCLAVLPLAEGASLTLWQRKAGAPAVDPRAQAAFPIFATRDAAAALATLQRRGVHVGELERGDGVVYFRFHDADGNCLEACQTLAC